MDIATQLRGSGGGWPELPPEPGAARHYCVSSGSCAGSFRHPLGSGRGSVIVMEPPEHRDGNDLAGIAAGLPRC
jgi:hypothetical protein